METDVEKIYDLELAQRLYREYHSTCFWHMKRDLIVNQAAIPAVLKGLRIYGGHRGWFDAAKLAQTGRSEDSCR